MGLSASSWGLGLQSNGLYAIRKSGDWKHRIEVNELRVESKVMMVALSELKKFCLVCSDDLWGYLHQAGGLGLQSNGLNAIRKSGDCKHSIEANELRVESKVMMEALSELKISCLVCSHK